MDGSPLRAALDAGLSEIGAHFDDLSGLGILGSTDPDLDPLGVEFDLSQLPQEPEEEETAGQRVPVGAASLGPSYQAIDHRAPAVAAAATAVVEGGSLPRVGGAGGGRSANLVARSGVGGAGAGAGVGAGATGGAAAADAAAGHAPAGAVIVGGGDLSRGPSFGISGPAAVSSVLGAGGAWAGAGAGVPALGEPLLRQSSLDINTIMQVRDVAGAKLSSVHGTQV